MSAPTTPLKWSTKKNNATAQATTSNSYHLKSPTAHRTPGGGSQHSSNGGPARSMRSSNGGSNNRMTAVFCDVVVEGAERNASGWDLPPEIMSFLPTLGDTLVKPTSSPAFPTTPSRAGLDELASHVDRQPDIERRRNLLLELLKTEETYVKRLNILYKLYAHPLRDFTRRKDTEIINAFEAKQIFGNIEAILPANEALLADLRASLYGDHEGKTFEHWASVMTRHLEHFQSLYPAYILNLERAKDLERELRRRNVVFRNFIERTRASAGAGSDNCSLESLLIEPAQRIPRYRLLLKGIVREVEKEDKFRHVMLNAIEIASSIAALDEDEETRRAAALFGLGRSIDGLPPRITNSNRYFVDCIDVFDRPLNFNRSDAASGQGHTSHQEELLCTLFLFNDRLIIVKRESAEGTGRSLAGLDNINKLVKEMQMPDSALGKSKSPRKNRAKTMKFRGEFDLGELVAKDEDDIGFSLFLERPPKEFTDRWNGRPVRRFQILKPETPSDKTRFLSNIWNCMALVKAGRSHSSTRLWSNGTLSAYWNIFDKRSYLSEGRKAKIALQLVVGDEAPTDLPFGTLGPHTVATAYFQPDGTCDYCLKVRGSHGEPAFNQTTPAKLVGAILQAARQLRLYDVPPNVPGVETPHLRRDDSHVSSSSRQLSASSSRPRSVMDFMRSPGGSIQGSPRRTLSKASKASTVDSRNAASIFSGEYASTAQTSTMSQDSHGSPFKRPISSLSRPPSSVPSSAPGHLRHNSEGARYFRATSAEPDSYTRSERDPTFARPISRAGSASSQLTQAHDEEETLERSTDEAYDPNALARSRSDSSLYKSSSSQSLSLSRSRSGTVSRSASTQSMRIEEEEADNEEEVLQGTHGMTPERALSPPLQRSGTISRPMGPRQLGSKSPAASPQPPRIDTDIQTGLGSQTPSPLDDDPFLPSSYKKKRYYEGELNDDDSFSSKRALRELHDGSTEVHHKAVTPDQADRYSDQSRRAGKKEDHTSKARAAAELGVGKDLHRAGSLPRSPNTRSLYQRSRDSSLSKPSPLVKSTVVGQKSRLPRKAPPSDLSLYDDENQSPHATAALELHHKPSDLDYTETYPEAKETQQEIARLRKALEASQSDLHTMKTKHEVIAQEHAAEMNDFMNETIQLANDRIERETVSRDARIAALEAEVKKLKNENRALQALLRKHNSE